MQIKVYPVKPNAVGLKHPIDGALAASGSLWTDDGFTARLLTDGAITTTPPAKSSSALLESAAGEAPQPRTR